MAWPTAISEFVAAPSGKALDIAAFSIINAFVGAESERSEAAGTGAIEDSPIGTDVQIYNFWRTLLNFVYLARSDFACQKDPDDNFSAFTGPGYYHGEASILTWGNFTWLQFCESAECGTVVSGLGAFRYAKAWDIDVNVWTNRADVMYTVEGGGGSAGHDSADRGDILGPWIPVDMYLTLNEEVWTFKFGSKGPPVGNPAFDPGGETVPPAWFLNQRAWADARAMDYADLCAAAETAWTGPPIETIDNVGGGDPQCITLVSWPDSPVDNTAMILRRQCFARITGTAIHCLKDCDWYVKPFMPVTWAGSSDPEWELGRIFDAYADSPDRPGGVSALQQDKWSLWKTDTTEQSDPADFESSVALARYDAAAVPPQQAGSGWASNPTDGPLYPDSYDCVRGWEADNDHLAAVLRWDVDGGFSYIEE